jgi:hypothetical protein
MFCAFAGEVAIKSWNIPFLDEWDEDGQTDAFSPTILLINSNKLFVECSGWVVKTTAALQE